MLPLLILTAALAAEPEITILPRDPVALCTADLQTIERRRWPCTRYVWIPEGGEKSVAATKYTAHAAVSRSASLFPIWSSPDGKLVRLDFDKLAAGNPKTRDELLRLWDTMARRDKSLYVDVKGAVAVIPADATPYDLAGLLAGDKGYQTPDGTFYHQSASGSVQRKAPGGKWSPVKVQSDNRFAFGPHLFDLVDGQVDYSDGAVLQRLCETETPVVHYRHFCVQTLSTLDGGLYYEFAGIKASGNRQQTDLDFFLEQHFGVDRATVERLRADRRASFFQSGVTGKPRSVNDLKAPTGTVAWTEDLADGSQGDAAKHPLQNLVPPVPFDASEAIGLRSNGLQLFALFDGQGKLADEVPPNIAMDHTIPAPYTSRLVPGMSCIVCHGPDRGWKTLGNDVRDVLESGEGLLQPDVLSDDPERLERIAALYQESESRLQDGRRDYSVAVIKACGLTSIEVAAVLGGIRDEYQYSTVDAHRALAEAGVKCDEAEAVKLLRELCPARPGVREDVRIIALRAGKSITVADWSAVQIDATYQIRMSLVERGRRK